MCVEVRTSALTANAKRGNKWGRADLLTIAMGAGGSVSLHTACLVPPKADRTEG